MVEQEVVRQIRVLADAGWGSLAYDLALSVGGEKRNLTARIWREFGAYCRLPEKVVRKELQKLAAALGEAPPVVARSTAARGARQRYAEGLAARAAILASA